MAYWRSALALAAVLMTAMAAACAADTADVLPPTGSVANWRLKEAPRAYTSDNLYEYIDGNADLFLSYGLADAAVGDYAPAKGAGWISVDVYNMRTSLQAFGIFGAEKPDSRGTGSRPALSAAEGPHPVPVPVRAAAQSYESAGLIAFWKGSYYVKVSLIEGGDSAAAQRLAEVTAERITAEPAMPAELARLPVASRISDSERYLKTGALGHKFLVEAVSASYKVGEAVATLHIADLGTPGKAAGGLAKLREFEASTGHGLADRIGVGDGGFAVRDSYYGEMVVARSSRFLVIGLSEKATRGTVEELVKAGVASASVGAHGDAPVADVPKG
jgi:hypothetical protein